jgi:hypothetical protein
VERQEFGGLKSDQVKRLKDLETENSHLRRAISDLMFDKLIEPYRHPSPAARATRPRLLLSVHRFDPAKGFFDALAEALADGVAGMPRRAPSITKLRPLLFWRHAASPASIAAR